MRNKQDLTRYFFKKDHLNSVLLFFMLGTTVLLSSMSLAHAQEIGGGVDVPGDWWLGEGLKQGDQFSYRLCHVVYKECQFFEMDLWVQGDRQVGSEKKWLVKTVVYDGNQILKGDMVLGKVTAEPSGGDEVLADYRDAFKSSISWLSSFATSYDKAEKGPKAFSEVSWGKIGNIGGQQVKPISTESINVPAGTYDTVKIGWRAGGADSSIWVLDDFPFPIKADTLTHVSEGIPPPEYSFTLLDYKENVQSDPFVDIVPSAIAEKALGCPDPDNIKFKSIKKSTKDSHYGLEILYKPEEPKQGCDTEWLIKFKNKFDETAFLNQVQYDIVVVDDETNLIRNLAAEEGNQFLYSPSGLAERSMTVKEPVGINNYMIIVYGLAPDFVVPDHNETPIDYTIIQINVKPNDQSGLVDPMITPAETKIPSWVKNNAGLWSSGQIDDNTFVLGIQYMIKERIIVIGDTKQEQALEDNPIPSWVKNNAGLWSSGQIDDNTFVLGIQYMIKQGIIAIS